MAESQHKKSADPSRELLEAVRSELAELKAERAKSIARSLLEAANVDPLPARVAAVLAITDEAQRKELIESFPQREIRRQQGARPAVRTALQESTGNGFKFPEDHKSFLAMIR